MKARLFCCYQFCEYAVGPVIVILKVEKCVITEWINSFNLKELSFDFDNL